MNIEEVEILISKTGKVEIHVRGVKGQGCLAITQPLEEVLGGQIELREMTPESMEPDTPIDQSPDLTTKA